MATEPTPINLKLITPNAEHAAPLPGLQTKPLPAVEKNPCDGKKPGKGAGFDNLQCVQSSVMMAVEQAGGNVTLGYNQGTHKNTATNTQKPRANRSALEALLTELARVRLHGISEAEFGRAVVAMEALVRVFF